MKRPEKTYRVLSCDAGGLRGTFSLCFLARFEEETGTSCHELFDLFAGTSTGAIIAGGLSCGLSACELLDIYVKRGREIFSRRLHKWYLPWTYLTRPKYGCQPLERILHDVIGDRNIFEADYPKRLMIFAKDLTKSENVYFNNNNIYKPEEYAAYIADPEVWDHYGTLYKIICASAAAPIYFPPYGKFIDGGVGVHGNPVYQAAVEALFYYRWNDVEIYSVGTGLFNNAMREHEANKKNLIKWGLYVVDELMQDANEQQTDVTEQMLSRLATIKLRRYNIDFTRFDGNGNASSKLVRKLAKMDAADYLADFVAVGREMAAKASFYSETTRNNVAYA